MSQSLPGDYRTEDVRYCRYRCCTSTAITLRSSFGHDLGDVDAGLVGGRASYAGSGGAPLSREQHNNKELS
jgi:hypothetical protein